VRDDAELHAEVGRLLAPILRAARREHGRIVGVAEPEWWHASDTVKRGGVVTLALAWLLHDPERMVREQIKAMAADVSAAHGWAAASRRPSHAELQRRRAGAA